VNPAPYQANYTGLSAEGGLVRTIVICVEFSNLDHTTSTSEISKLVFEDMNRYYQEVSFGTITVVGKTVGWYRMNYTMTYYGRDGLVVDDPNFDGSPESWWLIRDAVKAADKDVDFNAYDVVIIVHAGNGEESSKVPDDIWSVSYSGLWITHTRTSTRSISSAMIVPESEARGAVTLGVYAHEFGHQLGLPDLYEYGSSKSFVGHWCLMDRGLWNGNPKGSSPAQMSAYCKIKLGWMPSSRIMIVNASMNVNVTLQPTELNTDGYQTIKIPVNDMEYYLVEVRQKIGSDVYLPSGGVIISYVNERLGSGYGPVRLIDAHTTTTNDLDDAAFDVGRVYAEPKSKFSMSILSTDGKAYTINIDRSGPAPDIAITNIRLDPSAARTNDTVTIHADIVNQGTAQATNFYVNCYIDDILYTKSRVSLGLGRSTTIDVQWKATGGSHNIRFAVDPVSLPITSNRNNDFLSKKIAIGLLLKLHLPSSFQATINGTVYQSNNSSDITVGVLPGTQQIEVTKAQSLGNGTRKVFLRWTDGNTSNPRTVTVESDINLGAEYKTQYYITVSDNAGSVTGEGWYDEASTANVVANTPCNEVQQKSRRVFAQWSEDSTSNTPKLTITVDKPYKFTANWKNQYYLSVSSNYGATVGGGWYDANSLAAFSVQETNETGENTRKYFIGWTGDTSSNQVSGSITMDSPKTVSATWRIEYFLSVISSYGDPTGEGWYDSGNVANVSVRSIVDCNNGTRHVFIDWTRDASTTSPAVSIAMEGPKRVVAEWKTQYKLTLSSSGLPDGVPLNITVNSVVINETTPFSFSDWYDSESRLKLNASRKITKNFQVLVFSHWVNSTGAKLSDTIMVNGPCTLTAVYTQSFGCIIATATFGSELAPEVQFLRNLRDQKITMTFAGSQFMIAFNAWYYSFSPTVAAIIASNQVLKSISRLILYPLIAILHLSALIYSSLQYSPELAVVVTGATASCMIGAMYFGPLIFTVLALARRRIKYIRGIRFFMLASITGTLGIVVSELTMSDHILMLSSVMFVLTTISLSAMVSAWCISLASRKLNWIHNRRLKQWSKDEK
jgi:M6 family metalloprotease-like protein